MAGRQVSLDDVFVAAKYVIESLQMRQPSSADRGRSRFDEREERDRSRRDHGPEAEQRDRGRSYVTDQRSRSQRDRGEPRDSRCFACGDTGHFASACQSHSRTSGGEQRRDTQQGINRGTGAASERVAVMVVMRATPSDERESHEAADRHAGRGALSGDAGSSRQRCRGGGQHGNAWPAEHHSRTWHSAAPPDRGRTTHAERDLQREHSWDGTADYRQEQRDIRRGGTVDPSARIFPLWTQARDHPDTAQRHTASIATSVVVEGGDRPVRLQALIDTGAQVSCIRAATMEAMGITRDDSTMLITVAGGEQLRVHLTRDVTLRISGGILLVQRLACVAGLPCDLLLGLDVLHRLGAVVDCGRGCLVFPNHGVAVTVTTVRDHHEENARSASRPCDSRGLLHGLACVAQQLTTQALVEAEWVANHRSPEQQTSMRQSPRASRADSWMDRSSERRCDGWFWTTWICFAWTCTQTPTALWWGRRTSSIQQRRRPSDTVLTRAIRLRNRSSSWRKCRGWSESAWCGDRAACTATQSYWFLKALHGVSAMTSVA